MITIACLHTAPGNEELFEQAAQDVGLPEGILRHITMPQLLRAAEAAGGLTPAIEDDVIRVLTSLSRDASAVLLTCSTLGPAVDRLNRTHKLPIPVIRVDRALAEAALAQGKSTLVLCATRTTLSPTRNLFLQVREHDDQQVETRLVPDAWTAFLQGDMPRYHMLIAQAVADALAEGAECIALAQASMSGARKHIPSHHPVLTSPHLALSQLKQTLNW